MITFCCENSRRFYEQFMQQRPNDVKDDYGCKGCPYHRPEWKYRFCAYTKCKYISDLLTFRENAI